MDKPMILPRERFPPDAGYEFKEVIGKEQILEANKTMQEYKRGKANLELRIVENEQWYKLRHWECMRKSDKDEIEPTSAWLFNCITNKHADAMDNFPAPNILPREEGDKADAEMLSSIIPVILDQCDFEQVYSDVWDYKLKNGTGVYGVFWDKSRLNGLGDISIKKVDIINLFWESGIQDIQNSQNLFHVELCDNNTLIALYPKLENKLSTATVDIAQYVYDDTVDTTNKSVVVDWYYKKATPEGKTVLHYCKYVNDEVLFATENNPQFSKRGWYDHGMYPFVFDTLFKIEGTPAGFGYIDVGKDVQAYIDRCGQAILKNMLFNAKPRYFVRKGSSVNLEQFADSNCEIVEIDGNLSQESLIPMKGNVLNDIYYTVMSGKVDELKETTGNRDISNGGTTSGVTAASAIAAMQEAGSKLSRDSNKSAYRAFRKIILMVVELIRQFYDTSRKFRIVGTNGFAKFVKYSNTNITPQHQGYIGNRDMGYRVPLFDIEITAQKQSPYSKMAQNELALQFYKAGFFNPQMSDQALSCLDMMDFDRKSFVMEKISANGTMYQQLMTMQQTIMMLATEIDSIKGSQLTAKFAAQFSGGSKTNLEGSVKPKRVAKTEALGGEGENESSTTKKARKRVAESTAP